MQITSTQQDGVTIMALNGNLDAITVDQVAETVAAELAQPNPKIILDLSGVEFMSSAGLRAILASAQEARNSDGDLRLAAAQSNVKRVLDFSGFTKILKYYDTVAAAVSDFNA